MNPSVVGLEDPSDFSLEEKAYFWNVDTDIGFGIDCGHESKELLHFGKVNFQDRACLSKESFALFLQLMIICADRAGAEATHSWVGCFFLDLIFYKI